MIHQKNAIKKLGMRGEIIFLLRLTYKSQQ